MKTEKCARCGNPSAATQTGRDGRPWCPACVEAHYDRLIRALERIWWSRPCLPKPNNVQ